MIEQLQVNVGNNSSKIEVLNGIPYTYLLHHKPTNTFYYGVRYAKGCDPSEFWVKYFTSSKHVALLRTLFGDESFEFQIRRNFTDKIAARKWECTVLRRMRVLKKTNQWLNRTDNYAVIFDIHPALGKPAFNKQLFDSEIQRKNALHAHKYMKTKEIGIYEPNNRWDQQNFASKKMHNSIESENKRILTIKNNKSLSGANNASWGKRWYNNGNQELLMKVDIARELGWAAGRLKGKFKSNRERDTKGRFI